MIQRTMISIRLKDFLEEKGVSLYRLAKDTGIAYQALQKIRDGQVTNIKFDTLDKICFVLDCTPSDLISYRRGIYVAPPREDEEVTRPEVSPKKPVKKTRKR